MSYDTDPFNLTPDTLTELRERLEAAVTDPDTIMYAESSRPIIVEMVEPSRLDDPTFLDVLQTYGWPTMAEDGIIEPSKRYGSSMEFLASIPNIDDYGPRRLSSMLLYTHLSVVPIKTFGQASNGIDIHGVNAYIHRSHALSPELFNGLHTALSALYEQYGGVYEGDDKLFEQFLKPENRGIVDAMYMGYRIMGNLIKTDDHERTLVATGTPIERDTVPILSADEELRVGH